MMLEGRPSRCSSPTCWRGWISSRRSCAAPHVRKVTSVADYVKRIHRELNDGRSEANVIPFDAETIAQELFVFTLGGDGRHELERVVASDFSRAQITVKLQSMSWISCSRRSRRPTAGPGRFSQAPAFQCSRPVRAACSARWTTTW